MLKDRGEPVGPRRCGLKYAPVGWDCDAANCCLYCSSKLLVDNIIRSTCRGEQVLLYSPPPHFRPNLEGEGSSEGQGEYIGLSEPKPVFLDFIYRPKS